MVYFSEPPGVQRGQRRHPACRPRRGSHPGGRETNKIENIIYILQKSIYNTAK